MAEIRIFAIGHQLGGSEVMSEYYTHIAEIEHGPFKGGNALQISINDTDIRIWPADKKEIKKFGEKLLKIAEKL